MAPFVHDDEPDEYVPSAKAKEAEVYRFSIVFLLQLLPLLDGKVHVLPSSHGRTPVRSGAETVFLILCDSTYPRVNA